MCRIHHCWSALSWGNLCWAAHWFLLVKFVSSGQAPLAPPTMATVTGPGTTIHHAQCTLGCANKTSIDRHVCTVYMKVCNSLSLLDLHRHFACGLLLKDFYNPLEKLVLLLPQPVFPVLLLWVQWYHNLAHPAHPWSTERSLTTQNNLVHWLVY